MNLLVFVEMQACSVCDKMCIIRSHQNALRFSVMNYHDNADQTRLILIY